MKKMINSIMYFYYKNICMKLRIKIEQKIFGTKKKQSKIQYYILKKYLQWIDGQCRHLCCFCEFRKDCSIIDDNYVGIKIE